MLKKKSFRQGRPRSKRIGPDYGTPELQLHRDNQLQGLALEKQDQHLSRAFLGGSHLHAIYALGWMSEEVFKAVQIYTLLFHRAHKSMGLALRLKNSLVPLEQRGRGNQYSDNRIEELWHIIAEQMRLRMTQDQSRHYTDLFYINAAKSWYQRHPTMSVIKILYEVMEQFVA